jgi:hypothetical protein
MLPAGTGAELAEAADDGEDATVPVGVEEPPQAATRSSTTGHVRMRARSRRARHGAVTFLLNACSRPPELATLTA